MMTTFLHTLRFCVVGLAMIVACSSVDERSSTLRAQDLSQMGSFKERVNCAYFWDGTHGVIGCLRAIYTYANGQWTEAQYPEAINDVESIRPLGSQGLLYATGGKTKIWVSADSGKTWSMTSTPSGGGNGGDVYMSSDGIIRTIPGAFYSLDANVCIADSGLLRYSRDGGITWQPSGPLVNAAGDTNRTGNGCYADVCRRAFYVPDVWGDVYCSFDSGATWNLTVKSPGQSGLVNVGILAGSGGMLFVLAINGGLYLSADAGLSWQRQDGVNARNARDKMYSFADGSSLLIMSGSVVERWDGLTKTLHPANPFTLRDWAITDCTLSHIQVLVWPTGIAYPLRFITEGNSEHAVTPMDTTIMTSALDTIFLVFHISSPGLHGTGEILIYCAPATPCFPITYWDTTFFDTTATIADLKLRGMSDHPGSSDTVRACDSINVPIAIGSLFCDSLILSAPHIQDDSLHALRLLSPNHQTLNQGDNDTIWLRYAPHGHPEDRSYSIHISGLLAPSNVAIDTVVKLHLTALPDKRCNLDTSKGSVEEPRPTIEHFSIVGKQISFSISSSEPGGNVEIVNVLGDVVRSRRGIIEGDVAWDLNNLPTGVYFLRLTTAGAVASRRFIIGE